MGLAWALRKKTCVQSYIVSSFGSACVWPTSILPHDATRHPWLFGYGSKATWKDCCCLSKDQILEVSAVTSLWNPQRSPQMSQFTMDWFFSGSPILISWFLIRVSGSKNWAPPRSNDSPWFIMFLIKQTWIYVGCCHSFIQQYVQRKRWSYPSHRWGQQHPTSRTSFQPSIWPHRIDHHSSSMHPSSMINTLTIVTIVMDDQW